MAGWFAQELGDIARVATELVKVLAGHRAWSREAKGQHVPA